MTVDDPILEDDLVQSLGRVGFELLEGQSTTDLVKEFQSHHGLLMDGVTGRITKRQLLGLENRLCGVPEKVRGGGVKCRWDKTNWQGDSWLGEPRRVVIEWSVLDEVSDELIPSLKWAWDRWSEVVAIDPVFVGRGVRPAHVIYTHKPIDGAGGTLAWAQLPCGPDRQLESRMDRSEAWHLDPTAPPVRGRIHLGAVMCHEDGHLLGLDHIPTNQGRALLNPTYRPDLLTPQRLDIREATDRYGPAADVNDPQPAPAPTPTPAPGAGEMFVAAEVGGATYEGSLQRLA